MNSRLLIGNGSPEQTYARQKLAEAITAKGVPTDPKAPFNVMAENVARISHESVTIDGGGMYAAQLFGAADPAASPLWNLYEVLAMVKTQYMGQYAGVIVCEYYKGYDSLQLQGADAYLTCDGDFYDYDALHLWHDSSNGRANRWVAFFFRSEQSEFNIVNTDISPRSMYVGGHIGTIKFFDAGRLTEFVCGIEKSDVVDYFDANNFNMPWSKNTVFFGVKEFASYYNPFNSVNIATLVCGIDKLYCGYNVAHTHFAPNAQSIYLPNLTELWTDNNVSAQFLRYCSFLVQLRMPKLIRTFNASTFSNYPGFWVNSPNLIDVEVGEMTTNLNFAPNSAGMWNPTAVLSTPEGIATINANIRDHIAAKVSDRTGDTALTFTVSANLYANLEQATIDAFTAKNWNVAGA